MSIVLTCNNCKLEYSVKPSKRFRSKYCSKYCHSKKTIAIEKTAIKHCLACNADIKGSPGKIKTRSYCCVKCARIHWHSLNKRTPFEHNRYSNGAGIYRRMALDAHGGSCSNCKSTDKIEVHHIDRDRSNNNLENLVVLCKACHGREHAKYDLPSCAVCKKPVLRHKNKYCSRTCYFLEKEEHAKNSIPVCKLCGAKCTHKTRVYCSRVCYDRYRTTALAK